MKTAGNDYLSLSSRDRWPIPACRRPRRDIRMHRGASGGFTLVELLVVIAIIALLVVLLIPAVNGAREAARRVQCQNHIKQLALGALTHEQALGHFPTGGWTGWMPDADRGFGREQPGGWVYNLLPFIEEGALHSVPGDGNPEVVTEKQREATAKLAAIALPSLYCPSRRDAKPYPHDLHPQTADLPDEVGRTDYGINPGEQSVHYPFLRSSDVERALACTDGLGTDSCGHWLSGLNPRKTVFTRVREQNGISFFGSVVGTRHVRDGTSKTYLIGEKYLRPGGHISEPPWISGVTWDMHPWAIYAPLRDTPAPYLNPPIYGSPHRGGFHMSFCDGSVRTIAYDIDPIVHLAGANRHDGWVPGAPLPPQ